MTEQPKEQCPMPRYRKKPVQIDAHQWYRNGDHPEDGPADREGSVVRYFRRPEPEYDGQRTHELCGRIWHDHGWIDTLEGGHTVCPGDWIITGVQGERYPCKPDIFEATYEPVPAGAVVTSWRQAGIDAGLPTAPALVDGITGPDQARVEAERDGAYRERAHLVALLAALTDGAVITDAPDTDEPGWQIVYLTLGGRQCSWHIAPRDTSLFAHLERVDALEVRALWDGHTTEEKYAHIAAWTAELAERCGPACAEQHTETGRCVIARNR